jgi:CBS domain-containing protein
VDTAGDFLAVVDKDHKFLGWIYSASLEGRRTVKDAMEKSSIVSDDTSVLNEALSIMLASRFRSLPIVDRTGKLQGILTMDAIQETLREAIQPVRKIA